MISFIMDDMCIILSTGHLIDDHCCSDRNDFNNSYQIFILLNSSPRTLDINEHKWIQRLKTIKPFGINSVDPFGIPFLLLSFPEQVLVYSLLVGAWRPHSTDVPWLFVRSIFRALCFEHVSF